MFDIVSTVHDVCFRESSYWTHLIKQRAPSKVYPSSHPVGRSKRDKEVDINMRAKTSVMKRPQ